LAFPPAFNRPPPFARLPCRPATVFNARVLPQQTIKNSVDFSGTGLHSGNKVSMTFLPAPPNTGIRFRRVDLDGRPEIEARVENVSETNRSTTLSKGNVKIHTVEHVLATFAGYGIDNAIVELDANEPPIADGSSREYCKMIQHAGVVVQNEAREPYTITEPIELKLGETVMTMFPGDGFKITCTSADKSGRFTQFYSCEVTPASWEKELAHARTFCFYEEIEFLFKNGLIKGGSLENAVVIRDDAVLTTEPLRYPEEFVRHKMLDIVGDLSLVGRPVNGHLIAVRPSHAANCEFARLIQAQIRKPLLAAQTFTPQPPSAPETTQPVAEEDGCLMNVEQVMKTLPHRYPFLMVDRVAKIEGNRIVGVKCVTVNEPFFQGHFPGHPIMPGVMQLEAIAQVAGILLIRKGEAVGQIAYFMSAENVKWRKPVVPGDTLIIDIELVKMRGKIGKAKGVCKVRGDVVSEADVTFMLTDANPA
jgi:UDP-3-O-[3-hydroxymyristoyl] N-acetylglucosamine deacetylase/3-hydroxyacyl-[acyl-carrier-protein] dehydratase